MIDLSKSEKRAARVVIKKGMMLEMERALQKAEAILGDWKGGKGNPQEAYHVLYKHIFDFDKHVARRYDDLKNDDLILTVALQLREGLLSRQELEVFSKETKAWLERIVSL
jgi:hypothetical protein